MEKGKLKKQKKYLSIAIIPHSLDKVKVRKFSALYSKLIVTAVIILTALIATGIFIYSTVAQNNELKKSNDSLLNLSVEQKNLLQENANEIKKLKDTEENYNNQIKKFNDMYNDIAQKYISKGTSSRSGGASSLSSFVKDVQNLKVSLDSLKELSVSRGIENSGNDETKSKLDVYLASLPTQWPTWGTISSAFGGRKDPFNNSSRFHTGLDIAAPYGRDISAAGSGTVTLAQRTSVYGNTVIIDHGHGFSTMYGHTSKILVKQGQVVKKGQVIARVGSSGRSTGAHLHFEVRINGTSVNPLNYLDSN